MGRLTILCRNGRVRGDGLLRIREHKWACYTLKMCDSGGVRRLNLLRNPEFEGRDCDLDVFGGTLLRDIG
jgi:hypothetical protein